MQHYAAFHLGLHCLKKYSFRGFPEYKGLNKLFLEMYSVGVQKVDLAHPLYTDGIF